jgi:4-cresol dehydrogenase (hydroxylating) flavoprotein subunit
VRQYKCDSAIEQWAEAVGPDYVVTGEAVLRQAETSTFATNRRISAIVRPANREEVQECLRIATRCHTAIYPISSGKNWGYGSRVPCSDNCVLLDLGRMNHIVDFSEELAYVTVEPGVTQSQLYAFLQERRSALWMDATGASPSCSLIGNTMERGFGHTPYGDHFAHTCGLEVVLPDGTVIETGFARFASAQAAPLHRWGVGPFLDGLFSQSNFGVVTRMTIWLMPAPEYFQAYYFRCEGEKGLSAVIDALRPLRLNGTIRSASHIANDYKVLQALRQYPWDQPGCATPLGAEAMKGFRRTLGIGAWNGSGALYGSKGQVREARRLLRRALAGKVTKLTFLDDRLLRLAAKFARFYQFFSGWDLKLMLEVLTPVYGLMKGIPTEHPMTSTYWRKHEPPPASMDPDRDGCGLLWFSPVAPNKGDDARRLTGIATETMLRYGFEPAISLTILIERSISCIVSITYDRHVAGEDERAKACYQELLSTLAGYGYHPYRLTVNSMDAVSEGGAYTELLQTLKKTLDPGAILAPGRYLPIVPA